MGSSSSPTFTAILSLSLLLLFLSLPSSFVGAKRCSVNDERALLKVKAGFNNPDELSSWVPNTDCCVNWFGVFCDKNLGRVAGLVIFNRNVTGQISPAIGNLKYLQNIDFSSLPGLTGTIPRTVTKLTQMNLLRLTGNGLSGPLPPYIGQLKRLNSLDLSSNHFSGSIPPSFSNLVNLVDLHLNDNNLCGQIPQGGILQSFDASSYANNKCLCGAPLPACT